MQLPNGDRDQTIEVRDKDPLIAVSNSFKQQESYYNICSLWKLINLSHIF